MKKLNNRGITTIEVLLCFILIAIITTSMYATISSYNQKRLIESYKLEVYTYKNLLTKEIQDDFIKKVLTHATYERKVSNNTTTHIVNCELKNGEMRQLKITQRFTKSKYHIDGSSTQNDYFMIEYGPPDDLIEYPIPDLGETETSLGYVAKDLTINNVLIKIDEENVLSIYIGFYHPELSTRYGINIICPVDYISKGSDGTTSFRIT